MITPIESPWEPDLWQSELSGAIRTSTELLEYVGVPTTDADLSRRPEFPAPDFPVLVPRGFAARMKKGDAADPLLRQVLATDTEEETVVAFVKDPLAETQTQVSPAPGLIKKYAGRALLITTTGCAVHCRYCFRRHFPYSAHRPKEQEQALVALRADPSIREVILSGGDPLLLDDIALGRLLQELGNIEHVERIRIHSRIPVVLPERVTQALLTTLQQCPVPVVMVIHSNHTRELDATTARALGALKQHVLWLLNQAVLLAGVNNSIEAQTELAEGLFSQGVMPYYLHMPDRVAGTHHFFVDDAEAQFIYHGMQASLPGYLVPRLVREIPGESSKTLLPF